MREATFNALASLGGLDGAVVLDLFAGSGAMGVEAMSRGAEAVTFVDRDPRAVAAIRANVAAADFVDRSRVLRGDVAGFLADGSGHADLVVLDPPYAWTDDAWAALFERLDTDMVVAESDRALDVGGRFEVLRVGRYGTTVVTLATHR